MVIPSHPEDRILEVKNDNGDELKKIVTKDRKAIEIELNSLGVQNVTKGYIADLVSRLEQSATAWGMWYGTIMTIKQAISMEEIKKNKDLTIN